jgi:sulfhydrogenase subunit beta (sulfur reductase)
MMIVKRLKKDDLGKFMDRLARDHTVIGPVKDRSVFVYSEIDDDHPLALDHPRTVVPVKKYLHPCRDTMFELKKGEFRETIPDEKYAFVGLHICDINAIARLDMAMAGDPYYKARRDGALIVGVTCKPTEECFCKSMKADELPAGVCDLFLKEDGDGYLVVPGTEKGRKLSGATLFQTTDKSVEKVSVEYDEKRHIELEKVWRNFLKNNQNPLWDEMAKQCLGCTNCTTTCPLCYCYDVADKTAVVPENPVRERFWDSCTLLNFGTVAGGHKFRPEIRARYKNIYTHKFQSFVDEFGLPACVGCGRCIAFCPAGINMRQNLERLEVG